MFLCLIKFKSKYSEGQGQGQQNQVRAGPDQPVDSLSTEGSQRGPGLTYILMLVV